MRDAKTHLLSPTGRYCVAHEGIYALCLGTIYVHGMLPREREGSRAMAIQLAFELMEMTVQDLQRMLTANRHLEEMCERPSTAVTEQSVVDLVALGDRALSQARLIYPDSFF
mgnify:FL=1